MQIIQIADTGYLAYFILVKTIDATCFGYAMICEYNTPKIPL